MLLRMASISPYLRQLLSSLMSCRGGADFFCYYQNSIALVAIIINTTFFQDKFHVQLTPPGPKAPARIADDPQLHMIVYLQVAVISQALIFVTRSHGFFFMER